MPVVVHLVFEVNEKEYRKLIPAISISAEIHTIRGAVVITNESHNAQLYATGVFENGDKK